MQIFDAFNMPPVFPPKGFLECFSEFYFSHGQSVFGVGLGKIIRISTTFDILNQHPRFAARRNANLKNHRFQRPKLNSDAINID